jgi:DNA-binding CsgD family transcriptional regulator
LVEVRGGALPRGVALSIGESGLRRKVEAALLGFRPHWRIVEAFADADLAIADHPVEVALPVILIGPRQAVASALRRGFAGALLASFSAAELGIALEAAAHGLVCLPRDLAWAEPEPNVRGVRELTARESDVLELMASGASNKQIARQLAISIHTVKFHVASIITKLGASGRTDAVARALRLGREML